MANSAINNWYSFSHDSKRNMSGIRFVGSDGADKQDRSRSGLDEAREEMEFLVGQDRRRREKEHLLGILGQQELHESTLRAASSASLSNSDPMLAFELSTNDKKDKKKKKKKKDKTKKVKKETKKKKKKKKQKEKESSSSESDEDEAAPVTRGSVMVKREAAGLNWISAPPSAPISKKVDILEEQADEEEKQMLTEEEQKIEDEVRRGTRDPVSKRPYGLYDPKKARAEDAPPPSYLEKQSIQPKETLRKVQYSKKDLNQLAGKLMKAKMKGDITLQGKLGERIEYLKNHGELIAEEATGSRKSVEVLKQESEVILAPVDASGKMLSSLTKMDIEMLNGDPRKRKRSLLHESEFEEVEKDMSIQEMARREREEDDMDKSFVRNVIKNKKFENMKSSRSGYDEDMEGEAELQQLKMHRSKRSRMTEAKMFEIDRQSAINAHQKAAKAELTCPFSFQNPKFQKHLVVVIGQHAYLMMPVYPIGAGHCRIVPVNAVPAMTQAPEALVEEVQRFKGTLEKMASTNGNQSMVYLETVLDPGRIGWHTCIECLPIDENEAELLPMFFQKALTEAGDEWTGNRSKLIDTANKHISRAVPSKLAYFHVEWEGGGYPRGGYAHIIEDATKYKQDFGVDVLRGIMGKDALRFGKTRQTVSQEKARVAEFKEAWKSVDGSLVGQK